MKVNNIIQKVALTIGSVYFITVFLFIIFSQQKTNATTRGHNNLKPISEGVEINNFSRTTFENGKLKIKVNSLTTTYNTSSGQAKLINPDILIFDQQNPLNPPTKVTAGSAIIISKTEGKVDSALLEGQVTVLFKDQATLKTNTAQYTSLDNFIHCPESSNIIGVGYEISGDKMDIDMSNDTTIINGTVRSSFKSLNKIPSYNTKKKDI